MKIRFSSDVWVLLVLLGFMIIIAFYTSSSQKYKEGLEIFPKRSTYSAKPAGMRALFDTLDRMGYRVIRHLAPFTDPPRDGVLVISSPEIPVSNAEWVALQNWTERGNLLIVGVGIEAGEIAASHKVDTSISAPVCPSFLSPGLKNIRAPKHSVISNDQWDFRDYDFLTVNAPVSKSKGKLKKQPSTDSKTLASLFGYSEGSTIGYCRWGKGSVIVLTSSWMLCNKGISRDDNLTLIMNALDHRDPSHKLSVTFDEFHHGYGRAPGLMSLIGSFARIGLAQILFGFILLIFAVSRRFGRPIPLREGNRQRNEYLSSMASLLKNAHASSVVRQEIEHKNLEDMAVILGLPPLAEPDLILETAEIKHPDIARSLRALLAQRSSSPEEIYSESALLLYVTALHKLRKELMNKR